jgi:predicted MFS family arabinose efflux permease
MGILSSIGGASVLLFSLGAGVVADRIRRRPIMIATDLGRALLLASVPLMAILHLLSMAHLIVVAAFAGILTVLFDVAYQSYLPSLVETEGLLEGNRLLSISGATAEILGPSLTGILVQLISAPFAVLLDAISFLISGFSVWAIRRPEPAPQPTPHLPFREEVLGGIRAIMAHPLLRALLFRSVMSFVSMGAVFSFYVLYPITVLHLKPASLGFAIACGGIGSLMGGLLAGRIVERFPLKVTFVASALVTGFAQCLIPVASISPHWALTCLCLQQLLGDFAWTVYFINETTLRQTLAPPHLLGRVNAAMQFASRGMLPVGALASGFLANAIGIVNVLWIGAIGFLLSTLWLIPLLRTKEKSAPGLP